MSIKVYGASDDLIEIEGDLSEEFNAYDSDGDYLAFSDGTVLKVQYDDDGFWRINVLRKGVTTSLKKHEATHEDTDYSDIVELGANIEWVVRGTEFLRRKG